MKQFQRLHKEMGEGGFSEHIPTETKPTPPGFMTSDFGTEEKIPSHLNSPQLIEAYATTQGLKTAPAGEFLGGWPYQGEDYLDRSRKYASRSAGTAAMALQNQKSMYDLSKNYDDPEATIFNPGYDPTYTAVEHERRLAAGEPVIPVWLRPYRGEKPEIRTVSGRS